MRGKTVRRATAALIGVAAGVWLSAGPAAAHHAGQAVHHHGSYAAKLIVADETSARAPVTDPNLVNPWGIAFGPSTPLWVANNGTSTSTLYRTDTGSVTQLPLVVTTQPAPTGIVFNDTDEFALADGTHPNFLFDSLSGQISAWAGGTTSTATRVSVPGSVYTGLALAHTKHGARLFAADAAGVVQVFNGSWGLVGVLSDPHLPRDLTPYNVAVLGNKVYVSYAPPPPAEETAKVHGAIDVFSLGGRLERRLVTGGVLNGPWGMALAPKHWGRFGGALLVGNEDGGHINAFDPRSGHFLGTLRNAHGRAIGGDGLWGIAFGNGVIGTPNDLVVVIGADEYEHGRVLLVHPVHKRS